MDRKANILPLDGEAYYLEDFFSQEKSQQFFNSIKAETPWEEKSIKLFGKSVLQPRLMSWYGDENSYYRYSGLQLTPHPWTKTLLEIKDSIEDMANDSFNSVLLNFYRNGQDSMGAHRDNEKELGDQPFIASVSLGETRRFIFRHIKRKEKVAIDLTNGSLLLMKGRTQEHWKHELPKSKKQVNERINLTYRKIVPY